MATIPQIRDALKTRLDTITGLNVYDTVPGTITPPAAVIRRRSGPRPAALGEAAYDYTFVVTLFASIADDKTGQDTLDTLLSPAGIFAAINGDVDLGNTVHYAQVTDVEADQIFEYAGVSYFGADVVIDVGAV